MSTPADASPTVDNAASDGVPTDTAAPYNAASDAEAPGTGIADAERPDTEDAAAGPRREGGPVSPESFTVGPADSAVSFVVRVWPAADPAAPVLLILPAMAVKAKYYLALAAALNSRGYSCVTTDLRSQGESTPGVRQAPNFGYREMIEEDLPAITAAVRERFPDAPLFLFGHSLGGQIALLFTAAQAPAVAQAAGTPEKNAAPQEIAGVITIGTGSVYWRAFAPSRQAMVLAGAQYIGLVSRLRGYWPGAMMMGGPVAGRVMTDWARHSRTGRYQPAGATRDYDRLLGELPVPVLAISLDADPLGPKSTVDWLARRLAAARVTRWHLDETAGIRNRGHFAWVRDSEVLSHLIAAWINETAR
jgi:predicted alpha/beta hydrolase